MYQPEPGSLRPGSAYLPKKPVLNVVTPSSRAGPLSWEGHREVEGIQNDRSNVYERPSDGPIASGGSSTFHPPLRVDSYRPPARRRSRTPSPPRRGFDRDRNWDWSGERNRNQNQDNRVRSNPSSSPFQASARHSSLIQADRENATQRIGNELDSKWSAEMIMMYFRNDITPQYRTASPLIMLSESCPTHFGIRQMADHFPRLLFLGGPALLLRRFRLPFHWITVYLWDQ